MEKSTKAQDEGLSNIVWQSPGRDPATVYRVQTFTNHPAHYSLVFRNLVRTNDHSPEPLIRYAQAELI